MKRIKKCRHKWVVAGVVSSIQITGSLDYVVIFICTRCFEKKIR